METAPGTDLSAAALVTREALEARRLEVAWVPEVLRGRGGCWVRGYTDGELELMVRAATRGGRVDGGQLQQVQLAQCLLSGPDPESERLLGPGKAPTSEELAAVAALPPGAASRLMALSDRLAGLEFPTGEVSPADGASTSPAASSEGAAGEAAPELLDLRALVGRAFETELVAGVFGELGGIWVREYSVAEMETFRRLGVLGRTPSLRRQRWAMLALVMQRGPSPDSPRLVGEGAAVRPEELEWVARYVRTGEQLRLARVVERLSGWSEETEARLAESQLPLTGEFSATGA